MKAQQLSGREAPALEVRAKGRVVDVVRRAWRATARVPLQLLYLGGHAFLDLPCGFVDILPRGVSLLARGGCCSFRCGQQAPELRALLPLLARVVGRQFGSPLGYLTFVQGRFRFEMRGRVSGQLYADLGSHGVRDATGRHGTTI
jgi:hypothetical protein